jgi:hypothetical protein
MTLPTDYDARKALPIYTGVLKYFPDAIAAVAHCSKVGNDQHNPGEPLHWAREKSTDEHNTCVRHLLEAGTIDADGVRHSAKAAWRALAALQKEIEADGGKIHGEAAPAPASCAVCERRRLLAIADEKLGYILCSDCQSRMHTGPFASVPEPEPEPVYITAPVDACPHGRPIGERCPRCPGGWTRRA